MINCPGLASEAISGHFSHISQLLKYFGRPWGENSPQSFSLDITVATACLKPVPFSGSLILAERYKSGFH
jgi:hypothetical protein